MWNWRILLTDTSFLRKQIEEEEIRRHQVEAVVDTGAVMLVLPREVVEELDLNDTGTEPATETPPAMKLLRPYDTR